MPPFRTLSALALSLLLATAAAPAAAQAAGAAANGGGSTANGGSGSARPLPATREELCATAPPPPVPANGFSTQSLGALKRASTENADWGYYRFGNASSPRPPLLLIAGFGSTISAWPLDFLSSLAADQEVIIVDNRGQGFTQDLDPTATLSIPGLANDTMEFVRALELSQPPNVLGWSMGGMIAASLVALHGDELGKVTAVAGSAGGLESTPPSDLATAVLTSPNSTDVQHLALGYALDTPEGLQAACDYGAAIRSTVQSPSNDTTTGRQLTAVLNYLFVDDSIWDLLPSVDNEVLLVVGREDEVVPADNSRAMATRLQRPWLVLLEGGHAALFQHQPVFLQVLDAFLSA